VSILPVFERFSYFLTLVLYCRPNNDVLHNELGQIGIVANENNDNIDQERLVVEPLAPDGDPLLNPHGTPWHVIAGVEVEVHKDCFEDYSSLNWRGVISVTDGMKRRIDYFYACFPMLELQGIVLAGLRAARLVLLSRSEGQGSGAELSWLQ